MTVIIDAADGCGIPILAMAAGQQLSWLPHRNGHV
jgi:hypothetical protein